MIHHITSRLPKFFFRSANEPLGPIRIWYGEQQKVETRARAIGRRDVFVA